MQISRILLKVVALLGLALALTFSAAAFTPVVAGAQTDGYDGYDGYDGGDDNDTGGGGGGETATPDLGGDTGGTGALPNTGGVQLLAVAGAAGAIGLTLRRLHATS